jgi:penicillin-binding protein 1A
MPSNILVANGEYYLSEFPPGQAVASLDLPTDDPLGDFLNRGGTGGVPMMNPPQPGQAPQPGVQPGPQPSAPQLGQPPSGSAIPPIPVPQALQGRPLPALPAASPAPAPNPGSDSEPYFPPIPIPRVEAPRAAAAVAAHP